MSLSRRQLLLGGAAAVVASKLPALPAVAAPAEHWAHSMAMAGPGTIETHHWGESLFSAHAAGYVSSQTMLRTFANGSVMAFALPENVTRGFPRESHDWMPDAY